ncbi:MAG: type II toxin-antitoxin system prevent-host-death family antitoxin [Bacteroidota bacterium]
MITYICQKLNHKSMKAITITTLRSKMKYYFDLVSHSKDVLIIPRNGDDDNAVVIMSLNEYNALKETEYLLSTNANRKRLSESIDQLTKGDLVELKLANDAL